MKRFHISQEEIKVLMKLRISIKNNMPIFHISSEPRQKYGLNQTKNKQLNYFVDKVHNPQ